ncbi:MAG: class I SAM-dependent methyltransferase [Pseudomonadota bacterium]
MKTDVANTPSHLYADKAANYFANARTDIEELLPLSETQPLHVLEIGCAGGHTLEWLKRNGRCSWAAGVEPYTELSVTPGTVDRFFKLDIEESLPDLPSASIDLILCLDVLEHLVDPWETLRRLDKFLKPGGMWIISVPNIRNYHILTDLAFKGRFDYANDGILDRTHLRFFTRASAIQLAEITGAKVQRILLPEMHRWQKKFLSRLGLGDLLAKQLILQAIK